MYKKFLAGLAGMLLVLGIGASPAYAVTTYFYATGYQSVTATGVAANLGVYSPNVYNSDHTLAEIMIKNSSGDTLEFGWRKVAGGTPRLFAGHWEAGVFQGYNNADFLDYGLNATDLNADLSAVTGTVKTFHIQYQAGSGGNWWLAYNGNWVASIDDAKFSPTFTTGSEIQAYAEVASPTTTTPCTDMWTGSFPAAPASGGVISTVKYYDTGGTLQTANLTKVATTPAYYNLVSVAGTTNTFVYGGPGAC